MLENGTLTSFFTHVTNRSGSDKFGEIVLKLDYGCGKSWYRSAKIPIKVWVLQGLMVENCMTVDENNRREIVANVTNFSPFPFLLLYSDGKENHKKEIPIGPRNSKLMLINDVKIPYTAKLKDFREEIAKTLKWKSVLHFHNSLTTISL